MTEHTPQNVVTRVLPAPLLTVTSADAQMSDPEEQGVSGGPSLWADHGRPLDAIPPASLSCFLPQSPLCTGSNHRFLSELTRVQGTQEESSGDPGEGHPH